MDYTDQLASLLDLSAKKKDERNRVSTYLAYLKTVQNPWYEPDLDSYDRYLEQVKHLIPSSRAAHMGAIRTFYKNLLKDEKVNELLISISKSMDEPELFLQQVRDSMERATQTSSGKVVFQRKPNITHISPHQIEAIFQLFDLCKTSGVRDAIAFGLIYCGGLNEIDLSVVGVQDFKRVAGDFVATIAAQPGEPERTVPIYDERLFTRQWFEAYLATYLNITKIESGPIMRPFFKGGMRIDTSSENMTVRAIRKMIHSYASEISDDSGTLITALDLRRTYARRLFEKGMDAEEIGQNLGHALLSTTMEYIGLPSRGTSEDEFRPDGMRLVDALEICWPNEFRNKL